MYMYIECILFKYVTLEEGDMGICGVVVLMFFNAVMR